MGKKRGRWRQKLAEDQGRSLRFPVALNSKENEKQPDAKIFDKLMKKAEELVETFDYEQAKQCYENALKENPHDTAALEAYAGVLLELQEMDAAEKTLRQAAELCPNEGHSKYFSLAQLNEGKVSLNFYLKGIAIITKVIEQETASHDGVAAKVSEKVEELKLDLSNAYCALVEIYTTDCCDEDDAEEQCLLAIKNAISSCSTNPEAFQSQANYQLIKGDIDGAKDSMKKSLALWMPKYQDSRENRDSNTDYLDCPLSYDARISTSKILIELNMFEECSDILEGLLDENDEVVDVWYLLGFVNYLHGPVYYGNARFYLQKTKEVATKMGDRDEEQMQHIEDLLESLGTEDEDEEEEKSDEWETDDEEMEV